jgi:hypothetical protein
MVLGGTILGFMNLCSIVCICIAKICYMGWGSIGPAVSRVLAGGFDLVLVASVANIRIYGLCHVCGADLSSALWSSAQGWILSDTKEEI